MQSILGTGDPTRGPVQAPLIHHRLPPDSGCDLRAVNEGTLADLISRLWEFDDGELMVMIWRVVSRPYSRVDGINVRMEVAVSGLGRWWAQLIELSKTARLSRRGVGVDSFDLSFVPLCVDCGAKAAKSFKFGEVVKGDRRAIS
ncbi:hypothetical protein GOBAR_DD26140 [Gossypium barbadense]|nr:hypothetical protein GOBAR_DD26140 [Gossypium barbadense]